MKTGVNAATSKGIYKWKQLKAKHWTLHPHRWDKWQRDSEDKWLSGTAFVSFPEQCPSQFASLEKHWHKLQRRPTPSMNTWVNIEHLLCVINLFSTKWTYSPSHVCPIAQKKKKRKRNLIRGMHRTLNHCQSGEVNLFTWVELKSWTHSKCELMSKWVIFTI